MVLNRAYNISDKQAEEICSDCEHSHLVFARLRNDLCPQANCECEIFKGIIPGGMYPPCAICSHTRAEHITPGYLIPWACTKNDCNCYIYQKVIGWAIVLEDTARESIEETLKTGVSITDTEAYKSAQKDNDPVNHPAHYNSGKIEVADFIEDKELDFFLGNVVKYVARAGRKLAEKTREDLEKARWYLNYKIVSMGGDNWNNKDTIVLSNRDNTYVYEVRYSTGPYKWESGGIYTSHSLATIAMKNAGKNFEDGNYVLIHRVNP